MDYKAYFDEAYNSIKLSRNAKPMRPEQVELGLQKVREQSYFAFADDDYNRATEIIKWADRATMLCLAKIISSLLYEKKCGHEVIFEFRGGIPDYIIKPLWGLADYDLDTLFLFANVVDDNMWLTKGDLVIEDVGIYKVKKIKIVTLVEDFAYMQVINHNEDISDPGRGHHFYSLKWFFESRFGSDEYIKFKSAAKTYCESVKSYLGYSTVKNLTEYSSVDFRRIVEHELLTHEYKSLIGSIPVSRNRQKAELAQNDYSDIYDFFTSGLYTILLGKLDFAESLVTAEWIYRSMKKARAVDLTMIGISYFKAVEQLLYSLICLRKNDSPAKELKRHGSSEKGKITAENIVKYNFFDTTIGSMAFFYENYRDEIFRTEISDCAKEYVKKKIFGYKDLRNGYAHKDNIHDWTKIEEIRAATYELLFLMIGSYKFGAGEKEVVGIRNSKYMSDYYHLQEYMNYYHDNLFCFEDNSGRETWVIARVDPNAVANETGMMDFSDTIFFSLFEDKERRVCGVKESGLPNKISLGKIKPGGDEQIELNLVRVKPIYESGKFVSNPLWAEEKLDY